VAKELPAVPVCLAATRHRWSKASGGGVSSCKRPVQPWRRRRGRRRRRRKRRKVHSGGGEGGGRKVYRRRRRRRRRKVYSGGGGRIYLQYPQSHVC